MEWTAFRLMTRQRRSGRRDYRPLAFAAVVVVIAGLGYLVQWMPSRGVLATAPPVVKERAGFTGLAASGADAPRSGIEQDSTPGADPGELKQALRQADALIAAEKYDDAIRTLNRVRPLAGSSAPAYHLLGRALLGRGEHAVARDFLNRAIDLDPTLAEVYFDHARASDGLGDKVSALGGMRTFLHLVKDSDPFRLPVAQARSAIWEWEAQLGRGVYGPTKGIPPGFTAEQIKRDGKGVATMMQKPETLRPDGTMDFEIKSGERFPELWKK